MYDAVHCMPMGGARRKLILDLMKKKAKEGEEVRICVNRRYCRTLKLDTDLSRLIKEGRLKAIRSGRYSSRNTFLVLPEHAIN